MGQVITCILSHIHAGRRRRTINGKPIPSDDEAPPPSYCIDIVEEHNLNNSAAPENEICSVSTSSQQQQPQHPQQLGWVPSIETKEELIVEAAEKAKSTEEEESTARKIGRYVSKHKILLVGEGDFSFSASLAIAFGNASNVVATSLDDKELLQKKHKNAMANVEELVNRGALVIHGVDATNMTNHQLLRYKKFDRIIFNFPHCASCRNAYGIRLNQDLVSGFLRNAKKMIVEDGEIHVSHKTSRAFIKWNIVQLALMENLILKKEEDFSFEGIYPGYVPKCGFGVDKIFDCDPCKSYHFVLCQED